MPLNHTKSCFQKPNGSDDCMGYEIGRLSASLSFDGIMDTRIQLLGKEREKHFYDH